jgi:mannosyl-3-phosphoglycerate phosphatase
VAVKRVGLVVTDLDGTLLDRETYEVGPALDAVAALREAGVPLVLCSSKTRAEMEPLAARIGVDGPLVVENGGAILAPAGSLQAWPPWDRVEGGRAALVLGVPRERLVEALPEVARDAGARVRPFASMSVGEVAALTGLAEDEAALAMRREYDEPFVVEEPAEGGARLDARLDRAARGRGLRVVRGGRLHHLTGPSDKGQAVRALVHVWPGGLAGDVVGLGDAANDLPLLLAVSRPIVMPRADGTLDPALAARLGDRERAPLPGPAGWSAAVRAVLAGEALPRVRR